MRSLSDLPFFTEWSAPQSIDAGAQAALTWSEGKRKGRPQELSSWSTWTRSKLNLLLSTLNCGNISPRISRSQLHPPPLCSEPQQNFSQAPVNKYSVLSESDQLFLNCTIDGLGELQQTTWITYVTSAVGQQISVNSIVAPSFAGDFQVEGTYNLVFLTRALAGAGQYSCQSTSAPLIKTHVEVIFLGKLVGEYIIVSTCGYLSRLFDPYLRVLSDWGSL